jgi:hypothetical protein
MGIMDLDDIDASLSKKAQFDGDRRIKINERTLTARFAASTNAWTTLFIPSVVSSFG